MWDIWRLSEQIELPRLIPGKNGTSIGFAGFYDYDVPDIDMGRSLLLFREVRAPPMCKNPFTYRDCFPLPSDAASDRSYPAIDLNASDIFFTVCKLADRYFYSVSSVQGTENNPWAQNTYTGGILGMPLALNGILVCGLVLLMLLLVFRETQNQLSIFGIQKKDQNPQLMLRRLLAAYAPQVMISYRWGGLDSHNTIAPPTERTQPACCKSRAAPALPEDDHFVKFLVDLLPDVWVDKEQIGIGDRLPEIFPAMVANAHFTILILEPGYFKRLNCAREFVATLRWRDASTRPTVALLRPCDWDAVQGDELSLADVTRALSQFGVAIADSEAELLAWISKQLFNADGDARKQERLLGWWARYGCPLPPLSKNFLANPNNAPHVIECCCCQPALCCFNRLSHARLSIVTPQMEERMIESRMRRLACASVWRFLCDLNKLRSSDDLFAGHIFLSRDGHSLTDEFHASPGMRTAFTFFLGFIFFLMLTVGFALDVFENEKSAFAKAVSILFMILMLLFTGAYAYFFFSVFVRSHSFYLHHSALSPLVAASCLSNVRPAEGVDAASLNMPASGKSIHHHQQNPLLAVKAQTSFATPDSPLLSTSLAFGGTLQIVLVSETGEALKQAEKEEPDEVLDEQKKLQRNRTFEPVAIDSVLNNLRAFLGVRALGLEVKREFFHRLLSAGSDQVDYDFTPASKIESPAHVYVFFLRSKAALSAFLHHVRNRPESWPLDNVVAVFPSFDFVTTAAPELLDIISILTGPSGCDKSDAPIRGLSNCVIAALADAVPRLLLSQNARKRV